MSSKQTRILYGTEESWDDRVVSVDVLLFTTNDDEGLIQFRHVTDARQFLSSMMEIKDAIADQKRAYETQSINENEWRTWLTCQWIPMTTAFTEYWTPACVPVDERFAIDDVRQNIGMEEIHWPSLLHICLGVDGSWHLVSD